MPVNFERLPDPRDRNTILVITLENRYVAAIATGWEDAMMYRSEYMKKLTSPEDAVGHITDGSTVVHGMSNAEPPALLAAMAASPTSTDFACGLVISST